jgi:hypothetical protein
VITVELLLFVSGALTEIAFTIPKKILDITERWIVWEPPTPVLQLDEARYHRIETDEVPPGWGSVPVELHHGGTIISCTIVAGSVGTRVRSSDTELHERPGETGLDTISIELGWWMFENKSTTR